MPIHIENDTKPYTTTNFQKKAFEIGKVLTSLVTKVLASILAISIAIKIKLLLILIGGTLTVLGTEGMLETNNAGFIKVRQMPISGTIDIYTEPGMFGQFFGKVTEYKKAGTYKFADKVHDKHSTLNSDAIKVRFNDGGVAKIAGTARFDLPHNIEKIDVLHHKFRSYQHLTSELIKPVIAEALILTASLMTAEESYSGRRSDYTQLALDQLLHGVYLTETIVKEVINENNGVMQRIRIVKIKRDKLGQPIRNASPFKEYGIKITQFPLDKDFDYEPGILSQISDQRDSLMKTVAARAEATKAQQDKITAEAMGQAAVMTAKYNAEVEKETAVIKARQAKEVAETEAAARLEIAIKDKEIEETNAAARLVVAKQNRLAAVEQKQEQILIGEGESKKKSLILKADGALTQKLDAYVKIQKSWAQAYSQRPVPTLMMSSSKNSGNNTDNATLDFSNAMQLLVAKQLGLDLGLPKKSSSNRRVDYSITSGKSLQ